MSLAAGTRLGSYEVLGLIGAGGMGEVYKATDHRLNRPVAIKALHKQVIADSRADRRLRAEAQAAASIDHPYVCKIYELLDTGAGTLIVMEFVEGRTLSSILAAGVLPLRDSLRYGSEIAEGLADAHARGLVHRDIKPSNVMLTVSGHVKLLDFGLARSNTLGSGNTSTQSALTAPGMIAGTPRYMSPEQALGQPVTGRSDLFSLGVVLFQCLTGQLPFEGATRDAYVHAMLSGRRRSLDELAPLVSESVRRLVHACLEVDPQRRPESATLATELRHVAEVLNGSTNGAKWRLSRNAMITAGVVAMITLAGAYLFRDRLHVADALPEFSLEPAVTESSSESNARLSPDGRWLSFLSDRNGSMGLFIKPRDSPDVTPIVVRGDAVLSHTWSPNGQEVACVVRQGDTTLLEILPAFSRGLPRLGMKLVPNPEDVRVSRWVGDSVYLDVDLGAGGHPLWRVDLREERLVDVSSTWNTKLQYGGFDVSTDGKMVVFQATANGREDLWAAQVDGSGLRQLTSDAFIDRLPIWLGRTNRVIFQCNRSGRPNLCQIDVRTKREGAITSGPYVEVPSDATDDGQVVVYEERTANATLWRLDPAGGRPQQLTEDALGDFWPSVSQDGRWIAFQRARPVLSEGFDFFEARILVAGLAAGLRISSPESVGDGMAARMSPDGTWVAYLERYRGEPRMMMKVRNLHTGETRTIAAAVPFPTTAIGPPFDIAEQKAVWTRAGAELYFIATVPEGGQIAHIDLSTGAAADAIVPPRREVPRDLRLSPDGRRLAYLSWSRSDATFHLHLRDLQRGSDNVVRQETGKLDGAFLRGWMDDGRAVLLVHGQRHPEGDYRINLEAVGDDGSGRSIRTIDRALIVTTRLDSQRNRMFVTGIEGAVHNIFVVQLGDGTIRPVTDNEQRGTSFSGVEPLADGTIIYSQVQRKRDIYFAKQTTR